MTIITQMLNVTLDFKVGESLLKKYRVAGPFRPQEVEVCVGLGEWQNDPINTKEGWSRMGPAFQTGANVACESQGFSVKTEESHFGSDLKDLKSIQKPRFWGVGDVISEIFENTCKMGEHKVW